VPEVQRDERERYKPDAVQSAEQSSDAEVDHPAQELRAVPGLSDAHALEPSLPVRPAQALRAFLLPEVLVSRPAALTVSEPQPQELRPLAQLPPAFPEAQVSAVLPALAVGPRASRPSREE
jgi:hypothetical protein